ncbi:MAG: LamG-like jellyroll fold domain-containing protein [Candidatus Paceibacterota bacterium]
MQKIKIKAFTLIELLVVIAIIGILSALIVVGMSSTTQKATIAKAQVFSNSLRNSLMGNLVSEWKFDENSGLSASDSWGSNSGTLTCYGAGCTNPTWRTGTNCIRNSCLYFDGTEDYVTVSDSNTLDITSGITIEAWVRPESNSSGVIISKNNENSSEGNYNVSKSNSLAFTYWEGTGVNNYYTTLTDVVINNNWSQLTLTYNYLTYDIKFYVNGVVLIGGAWTVAPDSPNPVTTIYELTIGAKKTFLGGSAGVVSSFYKGTIDEMRLYGEAIPAYQIEQNYFTGLNRLLVNNQINNQEYGERVVELTKTYAKN